MSTKIYDAYACKTLSFPKLNTFLATLRTHCQTQIITNIHIQLAAEITSLIDKLTLHREQPDISKLLYTDFDQYLVHLYEKAHTTPISILLGKQQHEDKSKILEYLSEYKHLNIKHLMLDVTENKLCTNEITNQGFTPDTKNEIVLFSLNQNTMLILCFGSVLTNLMQNIVYTSDNPEYNNIRNTYHIRDYHYQNQTDKPDDISDTAWDKRCHNWDKVMPSGIPSKDGICITLTDFQNTANPLLFIKEDDILKHIPSKESRIKNFATTITEITNIPTNADQNEVWSIMQDVGKNIRNKHGNYYNEYQNYYNMLTTILPDITSELINKQITDLL